MAVERWTDEMLDQFAHEMRTGFAELREGQAVVQQQFAELREGQAMMMQQFSERDARMEELHMESERRFLAISQQILELRQDFLNHMRAYHPPINQ